MLIPREVAASASALTNTADKIKTWTKNPLPYIVVASVLGFILLLATAVACWSAQRRKKKRSLFEAEYQDRLDDIRERMAKGKLRPISLLGKRSNSMESETKSEVAEEKPVMQEKSKTIIPALMRTSPTLESVPTGQSIMPAVEMPQAPAAAFIDTSNEAEPRGTRAKLRSLRAAAIQRNTSSSRVSTMSYVS